DFLHKANNLRIAHKGTIVVAIPMIMGLISLVGLLYLLERTELQVEQETKNREIYALANCLYQSTIDAMAAASSYTFTRGDVYEEAFNKALRESDENYRRMQELIKGDPRRIQAIAHLWSIEEKLFRSIRTIMTLSSEGEDPGQLLNLLSLRSHTQALGRQFQSEMASLRKLEEKLEKESQTTSRRHTQLKQLLVAIALFTNLITIALAAYFSQNITKRLETVRENAVLLASGAPLHSPSSGTDEVAALDRIFHQMANSLHAAALRERALIDNALDVICSIDANYKFIEVNPACKQVWGYSDSELMGKRIVEIIAREDVEASLNALAKLTSDDSVNVLENKVVKADGTVAYAQWSLNWSPDKKTYFCVIHDVTERHEIERLKQEFVSMVSHDLRSPIASLQGILSLLELGAYGQLSEKGNNMLKTADTEMTRLMRLIDGLLDLEKMEAGKMELDRSAVDLQMIVKQTLDAVGYLAESAGIRIETPSEKLDVYADGPKLVQVVINLVANAIKFSPAGSTIAISYEDLGDCIELSVSDQGRGIPVSQQEHIFERFKQVDVKDHSEKGGKGLGLAICKSIVDAHGGTIGVDSMEGEGSTFWFTIPYEE
ncbi:MAG: cell wall metabolism sensor histidine kinase WalK, partial [Cyanobacteria bacterium]|nr:cell wall metabolism sensor histidine kinase WalK [Cyanobacteriota bacterium]